MFKKSVLALAATASVVAAAAPVAADARTRHHHYYRTNHVYRGSNGRYYCHRGNGTVGTIVGAGAGALIGGAVTHGSTGPILGAVGGGLLGRHVARHSVHCR